MAVVEIKLSPTLTAEVQDAYVDEKSWSGGYRYFIVLKFGHAEISRWEWQADRLPEERSEPDEYEISDFVAGKLREILTAKS